MSGYKDSHILTYTGRLVNPLHLRESDIDIVDIAHSLSQICRYCGHTKGFYSVAQHSLYVSMMLEEEYPLDLGLALHGLLHDASEAYLHDISGPIKNTSVFDEYRKIEYQAERVIWNRFELNEVMPGEVKEFDIRLLRTEQRDIMPWHRPYPTVEFSYLPIEMDVPMKDVEREFLERFYELRGRLNNTEAAPDLTSPSNILEV